MNTCQIECETAADCPEIPNVLFGTPLHWTCQEGLCIGVSCLSDADCLPDEACRGGQCAAPCMPFTASCDEPPACCEIDVCEPPGQYPPPGCCPGPEDCCLAGPCCDDPAGCCIDNRDACVDGYCMRQPEESRPPCEGDADCAWLCDGLVAQVGAVCVCRDSGVCGVVFEDTMCATAADCSFAQCPGDPEPPLQGADNYACTEGWCVWTGCNDDAECGGQGSCDGATGACAPACERDADCAGVADYLATYGMAAMPAECVEGTCRVVDLCEADTDCIRARAGRCVVPPGRSGHCVYGEPPCFSDADCPAWQKCRQNTCRHYFTDADPGSVGRACVEDDQCAARHMYQSILNSGPWPLEISMMQVDVPEACGRFCEQDAECREGMRCVSLPRGSALDELFTERTACLPEACTSFGGCAASLAACEVDAECPAGEACAWPVSQCPGVCMALDCGACRDWLADHTHHTCYGGDFEIDLQIIRPD